MHLTRVATIHVRAVTSGDHLADFLAAFFSAASSPFTSAGLTRRSPASA